MDGSPRTDGLADDAGLQRECYYTELKSHRRELSKAVSTIPLWRAQIAPERAHKLPI